MKRIAFLLVLAVVLLSGCDNGSYFDSSTVQLKGAAVGRLEATGIDLRVYEFTPQTAPGKTCIFVAGNSKGGLTCFDK